MVRNCPDPNDRRALERPRPRPTPPKFKKSRFSTKIGTWTIFGAVNPKVIVPMTSDKGVWQNLATVAKDKKIRLPTRVYARNRNQDHIWYDEPENHPLDEHRPSGGTVAMGGGGGWGWTVASN